MPTDAPTPEEREARQLPSRLDQPLGDFLNPGDDPKGWDRASIKLKTHPVHPAPRVTQLDLLLPRTTDRLKLVADCALFGIALAILLYFPLFMANVLVNADLTKWSWWAMLGVAVTGAVWLFLRVHIADRRFTKFLESL